MEGTQAFIKTLLDPLTMDIVNLAVKQGLYPNEIAKRVGKSNSLVVKRLKTLEAKGVLKGYFSTEKGRAVKKYGLVSEEVSLKVNFNTGRVELVKRKSQPFDELVAAHPELFEDYKDYCFWLKADSRLGEVASLLGITESHAAEIAGKIKENLDEVFAAALRARLSNWQNSAEGVYFTVTPDYTVIPTQRLTEGVPGVDERLVRRLLQGETLLSSLRRDFPDMDDVDMQVERLSSNKMVLLEGIDLPVLNYPEINIATKERIKSPDGPRRLHRLGRTVGDKLGALLGRQSEDALRSLFRGLVIRKSMKGEKIILPKCGVCSGLKDRSCHFIAGVLEGLYESWGKAATVREEACKAEGAGACRFSVSFRKMPVKGTERVRELLG